MKREGKLFVISAPSGTGKTTVVRKLLSQHPELFESISYTTRLPRPDERDGISYFFVDGETFEQYVVKGFFAEWAEVHGARYGTPMKPIEESLKRGRDAVLDVDVQGGMALKQRFPHAVTIFLLPPDEDELTRRLRGRGTEKESQIEERLGNAKREMKYKDKYDHCVINDDVDRAVDEIIMIMGLA